MDARAILFYGKSGSGKGTQAQLLKAALEARDSSRPVLYTETGQRLREFAQGESLTAKRVREYLAEGKLLPEFVPVWVWTECLIDTYTGEGHLILDGLARCKDEVPILYHALQFYGFSKIDVVVLELPDEEARHRLLERKRSDDHAAEIERRLAWYHDSVEPAIDAWRAIPGVGMHTINTVPPISEVHEHIVRELL